MLWFGLYLLLGCVRAQTKLELQSTEAQRVSLLRSSKASWDELILKNGGWFNSSFSDLVVSFKRVVRGLCVLCDF